MLDAFDDIIKPNRKVGHTNKQLFWKTRNWYLGWNLRKVQNQLSTIIANGNPTKIEQKTLEEANQLIQRVFDNKNITNISIKNLKADEIKK